MQINLDPRSAAQQAYYGVRLAIVYIAIIALTLMNIAAIGTLNILALGIQLWLTDMAFTHAATLERAVTNAKLQIDLPFIQPFRALFSSINWRASAPRVTVTVERPTKSARPSKKSNSKSDPKMSDFMHANS